MSDRARAFTLIEMLVVMAVIGLLLAVAAPRYVRHVDDAREAVLRHNLKALRDAIDRFRGDRGHGPAELTELVDARYLREVPHDPVTDRYDSWVIVRAGEQPGSLIADVRSGAIGVARDGSRYASW